MLAAISSTVLRRALPSLVERAADCAIQRRRAVQPRFRQGSVIAAGRVSRLSTSRAPTSTPVKGAPAARRVGSVRTVIPIASSRTGIQLAFTQTRTAARATRIAIVRGQRRVVPLGAAFRPFRGSAMTRHSRAGTSTAATSAARRRNARKAPMPVIRTELVCSRPGRPATDAGGNRSPDLGSPPTPSSTRPCHHVGVPAPSHVSCYRRPFHLRVSPKRGWCL